MFANIRANVRTIQRFVINRQIRGDSAVIALLVRLPSATVRRGYAKLAQFVNGRWLNGPLSSRRLRKLNAIDVPRPDRLFYVIVLPGTLHFLLPCLALVPSTVRLILLANGASRCECQEIKRHQPQRPLLELRTLPGSSLAHGDVITLLLKNNDTPFGILDHDLYVFDRTIYDRLVLRPIRLGRGTPPRQRRRFADRAAVSAARSIAP